MFLGKFLKFDWLLLACVVLLLVVGVLALYSISVADNNSVANVFSKQLLFVGIGLAAMFLFSTFNCYYFKLHSTTIYFITLFVLGIVLLWGSTIRGTSGWIGVGSFHIQPVEMAKLSLIIFLASFVSQKKYQLGAAMQLIVSFILTSIMILFVLKQPDVGSAVILAGIWLGIMLVSGINKKHFIILILTGLTVIITAWFFLADYQKARIVNVINPGIDPRGSGYNVIQSMVAMGSGGVFGKGIGHGSQSQLNFLPERHTDFIFAVIVEESGLVGSFFVLFLYTGMLYRMRKIAYFSRDNFSYLLIAGIMVMFALQLAINVGMNVGIVPVTGIPLPFLSYGGSSLLTSFIAVGIVLGIYRRGRSVLRSQVNQSY